MEPTSRQAFVLTKFWRLPAYNPNLAVVYRRTWRFCVIDCGVEESDYAFQQIAQFLPPVNTGDVTMMPDSLLSIVLENLRNVNKTPSPTRIDLCCGSANYF